MGRTCVLSLSHSETLVKMLTAFCGTLETLVCVCWECVCMCWECVSVAAAVTLHHNFLLEQLR